MKSVTLAKSAGFCYGVERAVALAEKAAEEGKAYLLGPVIHNDSVIAELERKGAVLVRTLEEIPPKATVILRSHGEARAVHEALREKGCQVVDTACPNVTRIHRLVERAEAAGRQPVIIGAPDHPEILPLPAVPGSSGPTGRCGLWPLAGRRSGAPEKALNTGLTDNFHPRNLGSSHRKSKKRVYKR